MAWLPNLSFFLVCLAVLAGLTGLFLRWVL